MLSLTGPRTGGPTAEDVLTLFTRLTGREPTPDNVAMVKARFDKKRPGDTVRISAVPSPKTCRPNVCNALIN